MSMNENAKAQAMEKSNFTRRCSLLSRYLKEKGSFGNIYLGFVGKPDSDIGLLGKPGSGIGFIRKPDSDIGLVQKPDSDIGLVRNSDPPGKQNAMHKAEHSKIKSFDLFQKVSKSEASPCSGGKAKDTKLSEPEQGSSQLTIFFGGKVLVYNEFPAHKAKEIMEVAKLAKPVPETNIQTHIIPENSDTVLPDLNEPNNSDDTNDHNHQTEQQQQQQNQVVERIARRASLHRFFAKRKDRAVARAPYQVNQNAGGHQYLTKPKSVSGQPLEPGQSSRQPDHDVAKTVSNPKSEGDKEDVMMKVEEEEEEGQCSKDLELRL